MTQIHEVQPLTNGNEECDIRKWFAITWFEYGGALLQKDLEKLDALAEEIETKFRANCYESGKWIVIGSPASYRDEYELPFCCFMAISMGLLRRRIPSLPGEPTGHDWLEKMGDLLQVHIPGDFSAVFRELGLVMKERLSKAIESRDEEFVTELYFRLLPDNTMWQHTMHAADWFQGAAEEYLPNDSLHLRVVRATGEDCPDWVALTALGQVIREQLISAVRSGDKKMVMTLFWRVADDYYCGWRDVACYDPAYQSWRARQKENDSPAA